MTSAECGVEHIVPLYRGGKDRMSNLALACRSCNLRKGTNISGLDSTSKTEVSLFHPRQERWNEHFQVETEAGAIVGITPTGRVTVTSLEINSPTQLIARQLWIRLGLFP
ncbi:HNH endonuclease [Microcoleus sp. A003_D6]|uniref:HNH endonuclease n=1 Tax=Microcoleus sp. A003_D6 TaxID=3055266 RepID=UPI003FA53697